MRFSSEKKHVVDFLFPIALFFVFAASSLVVIILAANVYHNTTSASESGFTTRTVLSYITEKIHQSDDNAGISIGSFDGRDALIIKQTYDNDLTYTTNIYEDNGVLRELFMQDGVEAAAGNGREIMEVHDFSMEALAEDLFRFTCVSDEGDTLTTVVAIRSKGEDSHE